jgi:hypothetical protein
MGKKRFPVVAALLAAAALGLGTGTAFAGEINGKGEYIAGSDEAPLKGKSECAYSGLNDEYYVQGLTSEPRTQHPPPGGIAGLACRGN